MIKRIIFDIDNTLIPWKDEYYNNIGKNVLEKLKIKYTNQDIQDIINAFSEYEEKEEYYDRQKLSKIILEKSKLNLPNNFLDVLLEYFTKCISKQISQEVIQTLDYLSSKYELVTLTNWFKKEQEQRLEKVGINKYFIDMFACEKIKMKPNSESYITAAYPHKISQCIMIGDNLKNDVEGAIACGMQAIFYNYKKIDCKYLNVKKFSELQKIL